MRDAIQDPPTFNARNPIEVSAGCSGQRSRDSSTRFFNIAIRVNPAAIIATRELCILYGMLYLYRFFGLRFTVCWFYCIIPCVVCCWFCLFEWSCCWCWRSSSLGFWNIKHKLRYHAESSFWVLFRLFCLMYMWLCSCVKLFLFFFFFCCVCCIFLIEDPICIGRYMPSDRVSWHGIWDQVYCVCFWLVWNEYINVWHLRRSLNDWGLSIGSTEPVTKRIHHKDERS